MERENNLKQIVKKIKQTVQVEEREHMKEIDDSQNYKIVLKMKDIGQSE